MSSPARSGRFDLDLLRSLLKAGPIAWSIHWEAVVGSTQDLARAAARAGEPEGWVLVTDWQRQGRGRLGRPWLGADQQDVLFSVLLRPEASLLSLLPLLCGVAMADGISLATGLSVDLKWPNDLLLRERKLAGVLLERGADGAVELGVGVNVNSVAPELPADAMSIAVALEAAVSREHLLAALLRALGDALGRARREGTAWIVADWRARSSMLGRRVSYEQHGRARTAIAEDIDADGALRVRFDDGTQDQLYAGDVRLVRTQAALRQS